MINFSSHISFETEITKLKRQFNKIDEGLESFKKLCGVQFDPISPKQIIAPAKLHRITQNDIWTLWKIELAVKSVRSNQSPRVWFAIKGTTIVFLCAHSHVNNYSDSEINFIATTRATDFF
jgi:hypothetical protein